MLAFLIADDHAIVSQGLKLLLHAEYPFAKIEEALDTETLFKKAMNEKWDLIITDINMPGGNTLDILQQIKGAHPDLPVLVMSMYPEEQYAIRSLRAGAAGYLGKNKIHEEIIEAVKLVLQGRKYITAAVAERLAASLGGYDQFEPHKELSNREFDVFKMLAEGKTVSYIADQLLLSPTTVSTYRSRIMEKMHMKSNAELVRYALEKNII
jgi:two-component system invasion response regulator UvrY